MTKKCDKCGEAYTPGNPVHVCFGSRSSNQCDVSASEPTSYVVEGNTYRELIAERDRLRVHLRQKSEQITRLQDGIEKMQQGSAERSAHEPISAPVAWRKLVDDPYERRPRYIFRDSEVIGTCEADGWEPLYARPAPPPSALQAEVERMRKLFWLAKEDVIFFSGYDAKTDTWPDIGEYWSPCVNLNDTFAYACADGERLDDSEIDRLIAAHKQWGYDGVVAWASLIRKCEPIEPRRTAKYHEARSALTKLPE